MPFWRECFTYFGRVTSFKAGELNPDEGLVEKFNDPLFLKNIDILLVRSTTKVNRCLIDSMPNLRFVGTATAGVNHLDIDYLQEKEITWHSAGGCNADAVSQYVVSAILQLANRDKFLIGDKRVGVIGHGNVGSKVAKALHAFGAEISVYDPPQQLAFEQLKAANGESHSIVEEDPKYVSLDEALSADIICLHAPLNSHPEFPSQHLIDETIINNMSARQYLINAGRGELIDNNALLKGFMTRSSTMPTVILDVWENEPLIMRELIPYLFVATPHIAGHTLEGKARGSFMLHDSLCKALGHDVHVFLEDYIPRYNAKLAPRLSSRLTSVAYESKWEIQSAMKELAEFVYDITNDDRVFRRYMAQSPTITKLRREYPIRREFSALSISIADIALTNLARNLGFNVITQK